MLINYIQVLPTPTADDAKDVKSILLFLVSILLAVSGVMFKVYISQQKARMLDKDKTITKLETNLYEELKYNKEQQMHNQKLMIDIGHFLSTNTKSVDGIKSSLDEKISPTVTDSNRILKTEFENRNSARNG